MRKLYQVVEGEEVEEEGEEVEEEGEEVEEEEGEDSGEEERRVDKDGGAGRKNGPREEGLGNS